MMYQAGAAGAMSHLNWSDGLFASDHAVQPISVMFLASVQVDFICTDN
jgi:hypothetical protein